MMTDDLFDRWQQLKPGFKVLLLILACVVPFVIGWWGRYSDVVPELHQREANLRIQRQAMTLRRETLEQLPDMQQLRMWQKTLRSIPGMDEQKHSFPVLVMGHETQVESWRPDSQPKSLVLMLSWSQFQRWFERIAMLTPPPVSLRLRLEYQTSGLRVQLWLEENYA